jgi:hypothetical protein
MQSILCSVRVMTWFKSTDTNKGTEDWWTCCGRWSCFNVALQCRELIITGTFQCELQANRSQNKTLFSPASSTEIFYVLLAVHLDNLCNENQPEALFILNLFLQKPLDVAGMFIAHNQEVFTVYVQQMVRVIRTNRCTYTVNTSWWWAINTPTTCRGCLTK